MLVQSLSSIVRTRGVSVTLVVCEEEGGLTRRRRRRRMRMQTCPPDHYRARMCPECCVPAIRQPADSNLMLGAERQWKDSWVIGLFVGRLQKLSLCKRAWVALRNAVAAVNTLTLTTGHMTTYNVKAVAGTTDTAKETFPLVLPVPLGIFGLSPSSLTGV